MRHSSRKKHLKQVHRNAHIRRICYFRAIQTIDTTSAMIVYPNQKQEKTQDEILYQSQ